MIPNLMIASGRSIPPTILLEVDDQLQAFPFLSERMGPGRLRPIFLSTYWLITLVQPRGDLSHSVLGITPRVTRMDIYAPETITPIHHLDVKWSVWPVMHHPKKHTALKKFRDRASLDGGRIISVSLPQPRVPLTSITLPQFSPLPGRWWDAASVDI